MFVLEQWVYTECKPSSKPETSHGNLWEEEQTCCVIIIITHFNIFAHKTLFLKKTVYGILNLYLITLSFTINRQPPLPGQP